MKKKAIRGAENRKNIFFQVLRLQIIHHWDYPRFFWQIFSTVFFGFIFSWFFPDTNFLADFSQIFQVFSRFLSHFFRFSSDSFQIFLTHMLQVVSVSHNEHSKSGENNCYKGVFVLKCSLAYWINLNKNLRLRHLKKNRVVNQVNVSFPTKW